MGGGGGWFFNGRNGKFLKYLDIVGRRVLTPLFYEDPPILPILLFSNAVHPQTSLSPPTPPPSTVLSVVMFL